MPQLRSKQILGDEPINPKDLTTKEYVDSKSNTLSVEDENSIQSGITNINFIGIDVLPTDGKTGSVDIWIPKPIYASTFNENDDLVIDYQLTDRHIASPTTEGNPYNIGDWVGNSVHPTLNKNTNSISYITTDFFSISLNSTFDAIIFDANGVDILAQHTITLNGNTVISLNNIIIIVSDWIDDSDRFKAKIEVIFNINNILPNGGRFKTSLIHTDKQIHSYNSEDIFLDNESLTSTFSGLLELDLGTNVVTKTLSGIEYYSTGTEWEISLTGINNINSNTYPLTKQITITDNNLSISSELQLSKTDFIGWTNLYNVDNLSYVNTKWKLDNINQSNWNFNTNNINTVNITAKIFDWGSVAVDIITSNNYNILVDTLVDNTVKRKVEIFRSESDSTYPRLESDLTTVWDSSLSLIDNDGLQIINNQLVYPTADFSIFNTNGNTQLNYSSLSGTRQYNRFFESNGASVSNGILKLSDHNITEDDLLNNDVIFEISIDNGSSWFILNEQYTPLNVGDRTGIRVELMAYGLDYTSDGYLKFTLQGLTTKSLFLKIIFNESARDNNKHIGYIEFTSGNWDVV